MIAYVGDQVSAEAKQILEDEGTRIIPMSEWGKDIPAPHELGGATVCKHLPESVCPDDSHSPAPTNIGTALTEKKMNTHPDQKDLTKGTESDANRMAQYIKDRFVSPKVVRAGKNVGVVISFDGWHPVTFKDEKTESEQTVEKPAYTVEIDGEKYEYSLSVAEARKFEDELRVAKTPSSLPHGLVGKKLKFEVKTGRKDYVTATIVP